jgi:hypothetical protein
MLQKIKKNSELQESFEASSIYRYITQGVSKGALQI